MACLSEQRQLHRVINVACETELLEGRDLSLSLEPTIQGEELQRCSLGNAKETVNDADVRQGKVCSGYAGNRGSS